MVLRVLVIADTSQMHAQGSLTLEELTERINFLITGQARGLSRL